MESFKEVDFAPLQPLEYGILFKDTHMLQGIMALIILLFWETISLSWQGDGDAGVFVFDLLFGAAFAHNFILASSPAGITVNAPIAVVLGIIFYFVIVIFAEERSV